MDDKHLKEISVSVERNKVSVPTSVKGTIKRDYEKLKRNSICPCEENEKRDKPKKYKNCCLKKMQNQEQQAYMLIHHNERIEKEKKIVAAAIQFDIDHPIVLPDSKILIPGKDN